MKKIVAAASLATLLAGAAFAADISFSYTGSNYFKSSAGNLKLDSRTDCMSVEISSDTAGAVLDFDVNDEGNLEQDVYYAWLNFAIPSATLQIKSGKWVARDIERVRADAGDLEGADFELYKPGVINGLAGKDVANLTQAKLAMVASYINKESLPGSLTARLAFVNSAWNPDAASATTATESGDVENGDITLKMGFAASVDYLQENLLRANLAVRYLEKKTLAAGLFVSPLMVENLTLTAGGTFAMVNNYDKYNSADGVASAWSNGATEWGADLRARYQITDNLSVTTMHNISSYAYLPSGGTPTDEKPDLVAKNREYGDNTLILWDMLNVTYKISKQATVGFTCNATFDGLDSNHTFTGADLIATPYVRITPNERIAVTASFRAEAAGVNPKIDGHETLDVTIPVIFAFNY